jgi:hypothetical protein
MDLSTIILIAVKSAFDCLVVLFILLVMFFIAKSQFVIMSGGQAGADRTGLDWANDQGIEHGGWCPKGRRCEDGPLVSIYKLKETPRSFYLERTEWNVRDSDATLIFTISDVLDGGSKRTAEFSEKHDKPFLHVHLGTDLDLIVSFLMANAVTSLNIAGKSASNSPGVAQFDLETLNKVILPIANHILQR